MSYQLANFIAEASKPKLYHWTNLTDSSEDWVAHNIRLDALLTAAGCMTVWHRLIQLPLLLPIPAEPQLPAGVLLAAPTAAQMTTHTYQVSNYKLQRESYDRIVKVHEKAEENAEKAFNKYPELHAYNSKLTTGVLSIQAERREAALKLVADLAGFGFTYATAQALIALNAPADAAVIAILTPLVNQYPAIINDATNVSILYAAQDWVEREFAPGKVEQRAMYADQFAKLRDFDVPEGASECIRRFITTLGYLEKSGGALPTQAIEDAVKKTFTSKNYAVWIKDMGMETLRLTPPAERKHSWQLVIRDIGLLVTREPETDEFRVVGGRKRTAAQAEFAEREIVAENPWYDSQRSRKRIPMQPSHPGTRARGAGNQIRHNQMIEREYAAEDARDRAKAEQTKWVPRNVRFAPDHYGPGAETRPRNDAEAAGHCWRCWSTNHFAIDCHSERCNKCTAPIKGGVVHNARICSAPRNAGAGRGGARGRGDARAGRGNRGGRGGRDN